MSSLFLLTLCLLLVNHGYSHAYAPKINLVRDGQPVIEAHIYIFQIDDDGHGHEFEKVTTDLQGYFRADFLHHSKQFEFKLYDRCGKFYYNCNNPCYRITIKSDSLEFDNHKKAIIDLEDEQHYKEPRCI